MARIPEVIVSMTTYPKRTKAVPQALLPLLHQTVAPDRIVLCLAREDFPEADLVAYPEIAEAERNGVQILWSERTLGPHDKYFWTMRSFPDAIVITVDDDLIYPLNLVEMLLETHFRHPQAVVAWRTHLVKAIGGTQEEGPLRLAPYADWTLEQKLHLDEPRCDLLATGGAGALYPPRIFDEALFDEDGIRELAPCADDLWMLLHELRSRIPVVNVPSTYELRYVPDSQECALCHENLDRGGNDVVLAKLFERYPAELERLLDRAKDNEASCRVPVADDPMEPFEHASFLRRLKRRLAG